MRITVSFCSPLWQPASGLLALATFSALLCSLSASAQALGNQHYIEFSPRSGSFALVDSGKPAPLVIDADELKGVQRAAQDFQEDVRRVSGVRPTSADQAPVGASSVVVVGTIGRSVLIDQLVASGKLDVTNIRDRWECFVIQVIDHPWPKIDRALVIAGSDKRGTIYGIYDVSEQIGVSPWYWWADVPTVHHDNVFIRAGRYAQGEPAVKYRGIFLNDEAPALSGWTHEKFGGFNHIFYAHVFELLLRLKANYLWPAMWGSAFNEDDPLNPSLADEYGIVMGTSHHEPMLRAQQEWKRHGTGPWDYSANREVLWHFWTEGIRRNKADESIVTIGMRGDGDKPMSDENNVALLEKIVKDQREILAANLNPDVTKIPQLWALYKEVQGYYENGMRVPDDVTLLWCDDNWGNIRRLPTEAERKRSGGAGVYYHFDYVGDPRNYKWINVTPISKVWEQMNLAKAYGADRIWIVNVGDLKPMEFPIEFFLTMAWSPETWPVEKLQAYAAAWATREFGPEHAGEIAELIAAYTKYNGRRKPELLEPGSYSVTNYDEASAVSEDLESWVAKAEKIQSELASSQHDAFFELVLHPVKATAIVNELDIAAAKNRLYALQGRASANLWADRTRSWFQADADLGHEYNTQLAGGKWDHMMDQTHIGYTGWQQPPANVMPAVQTIVVPDKADLGFAIEGSSKNWFDQKIGSETATLSQLDDVNGGERWIELFSRGHQAIAFSAQSSQPWLKVEPTSGKLTADRRLIVRVDWTTAPAGLSRADIRLKSGDREALIQVPIRHFKSTIPADFRGFVEGDRLVSIEAEHFSRAIAGSDSQWRVLPDFGRTLSGLELFPITLPTQTISSTSPHLEYDIYFFSQAAPAEVHFAFAPSQAFQPGRGLRCAASFDDGVPEVLDLAPREHSRDWDQEVMDSVRKIVWKYQMKTSGKHVLKLWAIDPGVVLEKIEIDLGGLQSSYLGAPESGRIVEGDPDVIPAAKHF